MTRVPDYRLRIGWSGGIGGRFRFGVSEFGGTDLFANQWTEFFAGPLDDVTDDAAAADSQVTWSRGLDQKLAAIQSGQSSFQLLHAADPSLYDPNEPTSPLNDGTYTPGFVPMRPVQLVASLDDWQTETGLFYHFIRAASYDPETGICSFRCEDLLFWLSRARNPVIAEQTGISSSDAVGLILDAIGFTDPAYRALSATPAVTGITFSADGTDTALHLLQGILDAEQGRAYVDGDGVFHFEDRYARDRRAAGRIANYNLNPSCETNTTGWTARGVLAQAADAPPASTGTKCGQATYTTTAANDKIWCGPAGPGPGDYLPVTPGDEVYVSGQVKWASGPLIDDMWIVCRWQDAAGNEISDTWLNAGTGRILNPTLDVWYPVYGTAVAPAGAAKAIVFCYASTGSVLGEHVFRVDELEICPASVVPDTSSLFYVDGDEAGCRWAGIPHASQSYRKALYSLDAELVAVDSRADADGIANRVTVTGSDGVAEVAEDTASEQTFGVGDAGSISTGYLENGADLAALVLQRVKAGQPPQQATIDNDDDATVAVQLAVELEDRINVSGTDAYVEQLQHAVAPGGVRQTTSLLVSEAPAATAVMFGISGFGSDDYFG